MNRYIRRDGKDAGLAEFYAQTSLCTCEQSQRILTHSQAQDLRRCYVSRREEGAYEKRSYSCACCSQGASAFSKNKNEA